jgi:ribosomal protein L25 (general stress protein Ctc)
MQIEVEEREKHGKKKSEFAPNQNKSPCMCHPRRKKVLK